MSVTLNDSKRCIAFICPFCYELYEKEFNIFEFSGTVEFSCLSGCAKSCMKISREKSKFQILIECPVCGEAHSFNVSLQSFIKKDLITFSCPEWNIDIFFLGEKEKVTKKAADAHSKLLQTEDEIDFFLDEAELIYEISELLNEFIKDNKISCSCGKSTVELRFKDGAISLFCTSCKNHTEIMPTHDVLESLYEFDKFTF